MPQHSILIAGLNSHTQGVLVTYLRREGFEIKEASDGLETLVKISDKNLDLVIIDVHISKIDYIELCKQVRKFSNLPIVLLVEDHEVDLGIAGLNAGADTFILKSTKISPTIAQLKVVLRRREQQIGRLNTVVINGLEIAYKEKAVRSSDKYVVLTDKEMEILWSFVTQPGKILGRDQLLMKLGEVTTGNTRLIDTYVKRIRKKLKVVTDAHWGIKTVWGIGYKLSTSSEDLMVVEA